MKKLLILALFVLGICNAPLSGMAQEIILTELYAIMPLDDPEDKGCGTGSEPNRVSVSINGDSLSIDAGINAHAYVEVIDEETGEVVAEEEFAGETTLDIPQDGNYELYIYTESGTVMHGEFCVN